MEREDSPVKTPHYSQRDTGISKTLRLYSKGVQTTGWKQNQKRFGHSFYFVSFRILLPSFVKKWLSVFSHTDKQTHTHTRARPRMHARMLRHVYSEFLLLLKQTVVLLRRMEFYARSTARVRWGGEVIVSTGFFFVTCPSVSEFFPYNQWQTFELVPIFYFYLYFLLVLLL